MIRRNKIIASVAVSVMTGVLVAGNLAPLQGYYAFAQETGVKTARYSAVKDINKTLEGYTPMDSSDPVEFGGTYIKYRMRQSSCRRQPYMLMVRYQTSLLPSTHMYITILLRHCQQMH